MRKALRREVTAGRFDIFLDSEAKDSSSIVQFHYLPKVNVTSYLLSKC